MKFNRVAFIIAALLSLLCSTSYGTLSINYVQESSLILNQTITASVSLSLDDAQDNSVSDTSDPLLDENSTLEKDLFFAELDYDGPVRLEDDKPLNYPNPFSLTQTGTEISYTLSEAADITIQLYSLTGFLIHSADFKASEEGGKNGYNQVEISTSTLSVPYLAPGIYLYLIIHAGDVIGKNRMVVLP